MKDYLDIAGVITWGFVLMAAPAYAFRFGPWAFLATMYPLTIVTFCGMKYLVDAER